MAPLQRHKLRLRSQAPAGTAAPAPVGTQASSLAKVAREDTVILGWSISSPIGVTNPWAVPGYTHQEGNVFLWEALAYYGIFASKEIPWLADSMEYNADFTQLTIKLNKDAAWSDGTAGDVEGCGVHIQWPADQRQAALSLVLRPVREGMSAPDDQTVIVNFQDPGAALQVRSADVQVRHRHPDRPRARPEQRSRCECLPWRPGDAPLRPVRSRSVGCQPEDLRSAPDWWAVKAGRIAMPEVKRIVMVNIGGQVGQNMDTVVQRVVNNEFDAILDMRASVARQILKRTRRSRPHTGSEPPYGYLDWWPNSLWMNTQLAPYNDPNVRRAMCVTIDRDKIDEVVYDGAKIATIYPFPLYPSLQKFADSDAVQAESRQLESNADRVVRPCGERKADDRRRLHQERRRTCGRRMARRSMPTSRASKAFTATSCPCWWRCSRPAASTRTSTSAPMPTRTWPMASPACICSATAPARRIHTPRSTCIHSRYSAKPIGTTAGNNRFSRYKNPEYRRACSTRWPRCVRTIRSSRKTAVKALGIYWRDTDRFPDHPVAAPHPLQPDLLDQLADRSEPGHGHQRRLLGANRHAGDHQPQERPNKTLIFQLRDGIQNASRITVLVDVNAKSV